MGEMIQFPRPDGGKASGYLATPKSPRPGDPGVVVIQEWWGLQDQIKGVCDKYAAAGYHALAPDLYNGKVAKDASEAAGLMQALDFKAATQQIVRGAVLKLAEGGRKVGLTGYCMGGAISILGAALIPELSAAVAFYGIPNPEHYDPAAIKIPLMGHYGRKDKFITVDKVYELENSLRKAKVDVTFHTYDADHAFCNQNRPEVYDPESAEMAMERTLAFFAQHLKA